MCTALGIDHHHDPPWAHHMHRCLSGTLVACVALLDLTSAYLTPVVSI